MLYLVGSASRAYMTSLNTTTVHGGLDTLAAALRSRQPGQALVTVCNHVAALDDPLLVAALLPEGALEQPDTLRWGAGIGVRQDQHVARVGDGGEPTCSKG